MTTTTESNRRLADRSRELQAELDLLALPAAFERALFRRKLMKALEGVAPRAEIRRRVLTCDVSRRTVGGRVREAGARTLSFIASTDRVARDGDVIEVAGWRLDEFRRNPVILNAHDHASIPVGRAVRIEKVLNRTSPHLAVDVRFAEADVNPDAERVYQGYRQGFLRALSVGFVVKASRQPDEREREERGMGPFGQIITAAELLEISAVSVPADPGALMTSPIGRGIGTDLYANII